MSVERLTRLASLVLIVLGIVLAGWGPMVAPAFGVPAGPAPELAGSGSTGWWGLAAFVRLFGAVLLVLGAVLWAVRPSVGEVGRKRFAATMAVALLLTGLVALLQQIAVWETTAGLALAALFVVLGLAYGWTAYRVGGDPTGARRSVA